VKVELIALAVILWLLLSLVTSCQNRSKPFQDGMKRWREHRQQKDEQRQDIVEPDDENEDRQSRRRERRQLFPRSEECEI